MKKQSNHIGNFIYIGAIILLLSLFFGLILEKNQITDFYTKPVSDGVTDDVRPVNDIRYTPADPTDNNDINKQKEDGTIGNTNSTPTVTNAPINVILTAAGQDIKGGPVIIKVLLADVSSGTCDVIIKSETITKNYSASVINNGTYYSCEGFSIPFEELEPGAWKLTVTVTNADRTGKAEQTIQVEAND